MINFLHSLINTDAIASDRNARYVASAVIGAVSGVFVISIVYFVITAVSSLISRVAP
ncbi:MAG: hypothetical protein AB1742_05170 [bacterium]